MDLNTDSSQSAFSSSQAESTSSASQSQQSSFLTERELSPVQPVTDPPLTLQRVNIQRHVLWDSEHEVSFLAWWSETPAGIQNSRKKDRKLRWERPKTSKYWQFFKQAAHVRTGEPNIICQLCSMILIHPSTSNSGTTNMKKHVESAGCAKKRSGGVQSDILDIFNRVCGLVTLNGNAGAQI
jgi:hypothetical protein